MSPVFRHGELRLYLLNLLAESPRHGYEVIVELENRFLGTYAPSAGTVYPRLAKLEDEGMVSHHALDGRKVYAVTDRGREELAAHREDLDRIEQDIAVSVARVAEDLRRDVGASARDLRDELRAAARSARREQRTETRVADHRGRAALEKELAALWKRAVKAAHRADPERVEQAREVVRRLDGELTALLRKGGP